MVEPRGDGGQTTSIDNPILNSPYAQPDRHYEVGPNGPTGVIKDGRRPSESWIPIAVAKKGKKGEPVQETIDFDVTGERRERNELINEIRRDVAKWRRDGQYGGVTPITRKLLQHWADKDRENRVIFAQREAAETAIFLTEVAGRHHGYADWRRRLEPENEAHNDGLPRAALKMATGGGKTVVMAMLIAWQTLNKVQSPRDARFTNRFLVVTPGLTIRDRLRVLLPEDAENYYDLRDLIPADLKGGLEHARIAITNYHAFQLKDAKEIKGVAKNTRLLLKGDRKDDPFKETPQAMVSRDPARPRARTSSRSWCSTTRRTTATWTGRCRAGEKADKEQQDANEQARVWFRGLQAIAKHAGIKQVWDLSATPFYLKGSGYNEGYIFPWTVSDFSLMDAIESGIVKVPRTPVDDDADRPARHLPAPVGLRRRPAPEARREGHGHGLAPAQGARRRAAQPPPLVREGVRRTGRRSCAQHGETPPVFIVVCPNTVVSKLVYDWIAGEQVVEDDEVVAHKPGQLALLSNVVDGKPLARPRTILIDSAQLESGEGMKDDFKKVAAAEIAAFKQEYRKRNPGADVEKIDDSELLREVMNTVGKRGRLGEQVRCVVSVSMLTEGWDANTVTHILGVRAFGSQLLCEQVVGRGLRRRSYAVNDEGMFEPEYAERLRHPVPVHLLRQADQGPAAAEAGDRGLRRRGPRGPADRVPEARRLPRRAPRRRDLARPRRRARASRSARTRCRAGSRWAASSASASSRRATRRSTARRRSPSLSPSASSTPTSTPSTTSARGSSRSWSRCAAQWIEQKVVVTGGYSLGYLMTITEARVLAAEAVWNAIVRQVGNRRERLRPMINRFDPVGSTGDVDFQTRKRTVPTEKSEVSHVTLDGKDGNTWEQLLASELELNRNVKSLREERPPRLHDPLRAQGAEPQLHPRTSSSGSSHGDDGIVRTLDRRGVREPEEPRADPARRRPPRATPGASRSTTTAASAAGATSR